MSDACGTGKGPLPGRAVRSGALSRLRRAATGMATITALTGGTLVLGGASPALAGPGPDTAAASTVVCAGWAACDARGDSSHGYGSHEGTMFWRMYAGNNCTNYAAYAESTAFGAAAPSYLLGNAGQWAASAAAHGVPVNGVPAVGAVAEWDGGAPGMGPAGHVAVVEQVGPGGSYIVISQQAIGSDPDGYDWTRINAGAPASQWQEWPSHFIHFAGTGGSSGGGGTAAGTSVGYYDPQDSSYRLQAAPGQAAAPITVHHGWAGAVPLAGDWTGAGTDSIGWYIPARGRFFLRDKITGGPAARSFTFGPPGMVPLAGNWDGRAGTSVGYYDPATGTFHLRNALSSGKANDTFTFGPPHMIPLAGDWTGSGHSGVGYYDPATGRFYLREALSAGPASRSFTFGPAGMVPLAGNWSGAKTAGVGFYNPADGWFHLRDRLSAGRAGQQFKFGPGGMVPLAGDWGAA
jgi:surface antigen